MEEQVPEPQDKGHGLSLGCEMLLPFGLGATRRDKVRLGGDTPPNHSEAPSWASLTGWEGRPREQSPLTLRGSHPGTSCGILP